MKLLNRLYPHMKGFKPAGWMELVIKLLSFVIMVFISLLRITNTSLSLGQFPQTWKLANVLPLFKKDNKQIKSNYRPLALLSCLSKICENVVFMKVYTFLVSIGFFYRFQSGFRSGDSTVMQLVYIVNKIYDCLNRGNEVRAVFLDISKAFDRVWHAGLLAKMKNLGVGGTLLNWFESYLKVDSNVQLLKVVAHRGKKLKRVCLKDLF